MTTLQKFLVAASAAFVTLLTTASTALAQVSGDTSQIPPASPKNWSHQYLAWPAVVMGVVLVLLGVTVYVFRMVRMRYPRGS